MQDMPIRAESSADLDSLRIQLWDLRNSLTRNPSRPY